MPGGVLRLLLGALGGDLGGERRLALMKSDESTSQLTMARCRASATATCIWRPLIFA